MKKDIIVGVITGLIIGLILGLILYSFDTSKEQLKNCYSDLNKYSDKMNICETICKGKGLLTEGNSENENSSIDNTKQKSYDYLCNCLAQPMKLCQSDSDCVSGIGYCDLNIKVCVPIKK